VPKNKSKAGNPRLVVGAAVHTKAVNVTSLVELSRFRGALAKTWLLNGTVLEVLRSKAKGGRNRTDLRVKFVWRGKVYNKVQALASVYAGPAPTHELLPEVSAAEEGSPVTQASQPAGATCPTPPRSPTPPIFVPPTATPGTSPPPASGQAPSPSPLAGVSATATAHGRTWEAVAVNEPVGGPVPRQAWSVRTPGGELIHEGGDTLGPGRTRKPFDYFMAMFPVDQLVRMVRLTSAKLRIRRMQQTTDGEVLKFIGVTLLATRYEFGARADLWATKARNKYMQAPAFGERTGMPRCRFDALWSSVTFSKQAADADDSEGSRWQLINEFACAINCHRAARVSSSDIICVDKSMCKWYGQGGH